MTPDVRLAVPDDVPAAAGVLADAFTDYPWTRWTVDGEDHGERLRALHRLFLSAVAVPFGRVDVGEAGEELVSVAVWVSSTAVPDEVWARVGPAAAELAGDRASAAAAAEATLAGRRLDEPHVTLASLGVLRHRQGRASVPRRSPRGSRASIGRTCRCTWRPARSRTCASTGASVSR